MCLRIDGKKCEYSLFRVWDIVVIVVVLALVAAALCMIFLPTEGKTAEVYVDGEKYVTLRLDKDERLALDHLTIVVSDGNVWVEDADCKDKICEKTGKISKEGQSIICLPNRLIIRILGKGEVEAIT